MASNRNYAYYLRGNQIAIVEEGLGTGVCSLSGYSNQTTCEAAGGTWTENATSTSDGEYRSPLATVADGLEIEYAYSPRYFIKETDDTNTTLDTYKSTGGYLILEDTGSDNFSASPESLADGSYIVLRNAGRWNGLHKVSAAGAGYINTYTKYSGTGAAIAFEETVTLYYGVDVLNDESDTIDLPEYLAKALVYYVKAKIAEDRGELEQKEYNMREFKRLLERNESSKIWGARRIGTDETAIK